jgi:hypothetical protein
MLYNDRNAGANQNVAANIIASIPNIVPILSVFIVIRFIKFSIST